MRPAKIQPILKEFWRSAEVGSAKTRASADADRKKAAAMPFTGTVIAARGPTVFVFFFVIFLLALIRADAAFLISGIFAAQGWFGPGFAVLACLVSVVAAIFGGILAGRLFGTGSSRWRGETPGFSGSIPGFRVAPYLAAVRDVSWRRFFRYSAYAGCWSILLTGFGFGVSSGIIRAFGITSFWVLTLVVVVLFASIRAGIAYFLLKADEIPER
jgi:hypothetical protein